MRNIKEFGIQITWSIEDVLSVREDLTEDQAEEVLEAVEHNHNASIGVNWDVIEGQANYLFPKPAGTDEENDAQK